MFKREGIIALTDNRTSLGYWCQGCNHMHSISVGKGQWTWDGNAEKPTISPSIRTFWRKKDGSTETRCHHFVRDGKIDFLDDSTAHQIRGVHLLQPIPNDYGGVE